MACPGTGPAISRTIRIAPSCHHAAAALGGGAGTEANIAASGSARRSQHGITSRMAAGCFRGVVPSGGTVMLDIVPVKYA